MVAATALLMVSRIRYRSFKGFDLRSRRSYVSVVAIVLVLAAVLAHPRSLMALAGAYLLWSPIVWLAGWLTRGRGMRAGEPASPVNEEAAHGTSAR
jgi:CDP-diacylglycerol--serine O-phosphatidyltransferase